MTPSELARMRNPLSLANVRRIRKTLRAIDYNLTVRCRNMVEFKDWRREISDDLCACLAILNEWDRRRKEARNGTSEQTSDEKRKEEPQCCK